MPLSIPLGLILRKNLLNYWLKPIDNSLRCMVLCIVMNENVQAKLAELQEKGWTLASIARALELSPVTVESWNAGIRSPANLKSVLESLDRLTKMKRIPPKKIYAKDSRKFKFNKNMGNEGKKES
ncbi:MAG: helix-turn-helix domain-containing protein [Dehalococcoidia bacterium]|nr:helix-turn-helix domain-containing protein [Dehalococcoidia bacterium]